jgi:hypothetical protein
MSCCCFAVLYNSVSLTWGRRYDYFPLTSKFVLRMPSLIHEQFIRRVVEEITSQLQNLTSTDPQSSAFAQDILSSGSTTLDFGSEYGRHDPDGSFRHRRAQYPGVVLEVAYSQGGRELRHLADDYILGSDGNIRAVVGVNIGYSDTKAKSKGRASRRGEAATISVWRPKLSRGCEEGDEDDEDDDDAETLTAHLEEPCVVGYLSPLRCDAMTYCLLYRSSETETASRTLPLKLAFPCGSTTSPRPHYTTSRCPNPSLFLLRHWPDFLLVLKTPIRW